MRLPFTLVHLLIGCMHWQEDELKGAVVLVYANKQVRKITSHFLYWVIILVDLFVRTNLHL
jgi:hypothetical protein